MPGSAPWSKSNGGSINYSRARSPQRFRDEIVAEGKMVSKAIPERFGLLRSIQLVEVGYHRRL